MKCPLLDNTLNAFLKVFAPLRYAQAGHLEETLNVMLHSAQQLEKNMTKPQPFMMFFKSPVKCRDDLWST